MRRYALDICCMASSIIALVVLYCFVVAQAFTPNSAPPYDYCQAYIGPLPSPPEDGTLISAQILIRHGDRTPLTVLPNDNVTWTCTLNEIALFEDTVTPTVSMGRVFRKVFPANETLLGNCSFGQLTEIGSQQHLALGQFFRSQYVDEYQFLSPTLRSDEIFLRSTDVYRTHQSAQSEINGMFPPDASASVIEAIEIETRDPQVENLVPNPAICPKLGVLQNELLQTPEYQNYLQQIAPVMQQFAQVFNTTNLPSPSGILDALRARRCHGFAWPDGVTPDLFEQLQKWEDWLWSFQSAGQNLSLLGMGTFVKEIRDNFAAAIQKVPGPRYRLYSGHDSSVTPFLNALRVNDNQWPPYASHVVMELWQSASNGAYAVRITYNGVVLQLPGCSSPLCDWDEFTASIADVIPDNYAAQCAV
eukprot:TRINITY_DN12890_c0_g1_i1.p1 TRINITY_DN12890_c0_g1~~TRINITY_DN12890_c0_g1_i1.p1  ORF type:complete len:418 (+),score=68.17 TRINITY_DN12890_c0_g1_i1:25-1278(+)